MEDYLHIVKNNRSAREYIEYIGKRYNGATISLAKFDSFDLYDETPIIDYARRLNVMLIPSILFKSLEGAIVLVYNPKLGESTQTEELLEEIKIERINRIINILYGLSEKFQIHISPKQILEKLNKSDSIDIYLTETNDILEIMVEDGYCETKIGAYQEYFKFVDLARLVMPFNCLVRRLQQEDEIFIVNPDYFISSGITKLSQIKGFIVNNISEFKHKRYCIENNLEMKFGSGTIIE